eukprot:CAMPEP_0167824422 /NCGR_PEP_ID=MMETSP0112_2-20121227/8779_1 /TAXON_ID=91324 /ORGANISM="Lotharella globosa, Strain CCCM811" /LENGTH=1069 /DNA_ID=CAMNT_0007726371 /DNA_START=101 /DNA_END=3307 /DNA_ORIENTATION=-
MDSNAVFRLLNGALSPDNAVRTQAEATLNKLLDTNPENLLATVLKLLRSSNNQQVRMFCAVLLRKKLPNGEPILYDQLSKGLQNAFRTELIRAIIEDTSAPVRNLICDTVAELAQILLFHNRWQNLVEFLFSGVRAEKEHVRVAVFNIFGKVADGNHERLGNRLQQTMAVMEQGMRDRSAPVRVAACIASGKLVKELAGETKQEAPAARLLTPMMEVTGQMFKAGNEDAVQRCVDAFVDVATMNARFFKSQLPKVSFLMKGMAEGRELSPGLRNSCLEVLVSTAEGEEVMVRRCPEFLQQTVLLTLSLMVEVPHDPDWVTKDHQLDKGAEENANFEFAEMAMDRLALAIGGRKLQPIVFPLISKCVSNEDWKMRRAGLMSLSQVAEVMEFKQIPINNIVKYLGDGHPRVRHAAANCIGQLSNDFAPYIQDSCHKIIIPGLLSLLVDHRFPRIQTHAAAALFNFTEHCEEELLTPYVDVLMKHLFTTLSQGKRPVQEQILTTVACIAGSAPKAFSKHYDRVMGMVMKVLTTARSKETERLRARAMECVSYIGMAVGKERFKPHATQLMSIFDQMIRAGFMNDDTTKQYMLQAWTRIGSAIKEDFEPYLKHVLPHVFMAASKKIEFSQAQLNGKAILGLTTSLEEKATACSMLCSFAHDINKGYFPFVEDTYKVMGPLMEYYLNDDVRSFAISIMPDLIQSTISAVQDRKTDTRYLKNLFGVVTGRMIECLQNEPDTDMLCTLVSAIQKAFRVAGPLAKNCLNRKSLEVVGMAMLKLLNKSQQHIITLEGRRTKSEDMDEEGIAKIEQKIAEEDELSLLAADAIGVLIKSHGTDFLPVFEKLGPRIVEMLHPKRTVTTRKYAIFILDDLFEFIGEPAGRYFPQLLPWFFQYALETQSPNLQQATVYGLGICAEHGGKGFDRYVEKTLQTLGNAIQHNRKLGARASDDTKSATDNAISAFGKVCRYRSSCVDLNKMLPVWLGWLPLQIDGSEAASVYSMLCALIESQNTALLGQNMRNLPQVVTVLVRAFTGPLGIPPEIRARMVKIMRQILTMPKNMLDVLAKQVQPQVME